MRGYIAIGTVYSNVSRRFYRGLLVGGVSRAIKASVNDVCAIYAREIDNEIHSELQQRFQREDLQKTIENPLQHNPRQ